MIDLHESIKDYRASVCAECVVLGRQIYACAFQLCGGELGRNRSAPNELVDLLCTRIHVSIQIIWVHGDFGWTDGLMGLLCTFLVCFVNLLSFRILLAEGCFDVVLSLR